MLSRLAEDIEIKPLYTRDDIQEVDHLDNMPGLPSEFSAHLPRNTQLILRDETGIAHVIDPLGGSYYIEALIPTHI